MMSTTSRKPIRIGIGGPVGSGKTMLVLRLCQWLRDELSIAVVTNDIYTREDAEFLVRKGRQQPGQVVAVPGGVRFALQELLDDFGRFLRLTRLG